jgi:hypothetical protein
MSYSHPLNSPTFQCLCLRADLKLQFELATGVESTLLQDTRAEKPLAAMRIISFVRNNDANYVSVYEAFRNESAVCVVEPGRCQETEGGSPS